MIDISAFKLQPRVPIERTYDIQHWKSAIEGGRDLMIAVPSPHFTMLDALLNPSPREQWKAWYSAQRRARRGLAPVVVEGELGVIKGFRFVL